MRNSLLLTVAAVALLAGPGLATAQKNEKNEAQAPAQQQIAPAEKMAPPTKAAPVNGPLTKAPEAKSQTTGHVAPNMAPAADKAKAEHAATTDDVKNAQAPALPAAKNADSVIKGNADVKESEGKSDAKPSAVQASGQKNQTTSQSAAPRATANLSVEQRTNIRAAIKQQNVPRATNVNFSILIGTHVPRTLHFYPLPTRVVEFYPVWRGYEYILVGDEILVIDPRTLEIVAVLQA